MGTKDRGRGAFICGGQGAGGTQMRGSGKITVTGDRGRGPGTGRRNTESDPAETHSIKPKANQTEVNQTKTNQLEPN